MRYRIRPIRADEWRELRELRLTALADPVARIAFNETYDEAAAHDEAVWRDRAKRQATEDGATTFLAEDGDGRLTGMVTVLVEQDQAPVAGHLVGVYIRPEHRGSGLAPVLFRQAVEWSWAQSDPRLDLVRLWVHQDNGRAEALYRKMGFARSGRSLPDPKSPQHIEYEMVLPRPSSSAAGPS